MKTFRVPFALLLTVVSGQAQDAVPDPAVSAAPAVSAMRTPQELEQLVAPIALYPDPLIALILPATTAPADVVLAARHVRDFPNDRSQVEHRAWDESVKSLTHYPEVLIWMDENLQWTKQLGEAFTEQPAEVMQAVQRLRAQARAAGTLVDTPQQQVLAEPQVIRIVPAQPDVIYVPHYEPEIVFVDRPVYHTRSFISFGVGVPVGSWLAYDCDWRRHTIWAGNRHRHWTRHDWRRPLVPFAHVSAGPSRAPIARQWRPTPPPPRPAAQVVAWRGHTPVARPSAFGTSATRSFAPRSSAPDHRRTGANSLPVANALPMTKPLPHAFAPGSSRDLPGPRVHRQPTVVAPAPAQAPQPATPPIASVTTPSPNSRGHHTNWTRGSESRSRTHQPAVANSTPLPVVPALPMASSAPPVHQRVGPTAPAQTQTRTYTRSAPAHPTVPSLPMATPIRSRSVVGPVAPAAASQPTTAPAAAAPTQSAPPQAAPAPSRPDSGRHSRRDRER